MGDTLFKLVTVLVPMILSLTVHEFAHAWAAYLLGDTTAKYQGRLTLNPLPHIDPIGTLLLPAVAVIASSVGVPFFGWAKPVPVNPNYFKRSVTMRRGMLLTAAAGPASNLILALISAGGIAICYHSGFMGSGLGSAVFTLFLSMFQINLALALFNLIPIYPLDGQKVLSGLLSRNAADRFDLFSSRYGMWLLMGLIIFGGELISIPMSILFKLILSIFGLPVW